jgi:acyl phosphate:glycerol-3-phosphate acyltransferase
MTLFLLLTGVYMLGNILTASLIGKLLFKENIRSGGSGNPGARNAGRLFGKKAFVATFVGDALKGVLAVGTAKWLGFDAVVELLALVTVMLGHVFPVLMKFRGGKGVSTFIGGLLVFNPLLFAVFAGVFLLGYPFLKSFTRAGLVAVGFLPFIVLAFSYGIPAFVMACFVTIWLCVDHREDVKTYAGKELRK